MRMKFIDDRRLRLGLLAAVWAMTGCGGGLRGADARPATGSDAEPVPASATTDRPVGAGAAVTGGAGGATVRVGTPAQLKYELCRSSSGGVCTDTTPRTIEIASTIDLGDSEGTATAKGCNATSVCTAPHRSEATLVLSPTVHHCDGKPLFDVRYNVAAVRGMVVGSNKTVLGIGANAAVKGKGFQLQNGVSNVVIRNLSITDIDEGLVFGGDAVTIADASRVWIDHNRFARVGRQFIVTGTGDHGGAAADVTISWNEFDGNSAWSARCDDKHYWNLLFYGKGRLTFANNWLHDFSGRGPRIEGDALVQVVNNHFQDGSWHAIDTAGSGTRVLVEGNYFEEVPVPVLHNPDAGSLHGLLAQTDASTSACSAALGRSCAVNIAQPAPPADGFTEDAAVLAAAKAAPTGSIVRPYPARKVPAVVSAGVGVGHVR
jgi:pectate lyase